MPVKTALPGQKSPAKSNRPARKPAAKSKSSNRTRPANGNAAGRQQVEAEIANRILQLLDREELPPWEAGWSPSNHGVPVNAVSQKPYRGVNHWLLLIVQRALGYDDPRWLTYRQAGDLGGHVRRGETGAPIIFWKAVTRRPETEPADGAHQRQAVETGSHGREAEVITLDAAPDRRSDGYSLLRSYRVFNAAQTENCRLPALPPVKLRDHDPIASAQAIVDAMPDPPSIQTYRHANYIPHYQPKRDAVRIPELGRYARAEDYYNTLFHELTHATGHPKRLARFDLEANANDLHAYGREELVAAMGAALLAGAAGLSPQVEERNASYFRGWRDATSADQGMVIRAATLAQRAADRIRNLPPPESAPAENPAEAAAAQ